MKTTAGLWIDHKKAVFIFGDENNILTLKSNLTKNIHLTGGARGKTAYSANYFPADDQIDRRSNEYLNKYYSDVITHLRGAKSIIILGPGEAKLELEKRLSQEGLKNSVLSVATVDKLTDRQLASKVKKMFNEARATIQ